MATIVIERPVGFSLDAVSQFYAGFAPGSGMAAAATDQLTLAFLVDHSFAPVVVSLREQHGALIAELSSDREELAVRRQLARMLGLEADAEAWWALGQRVPLVSALQQEFPGFLTAAKASPYDAAVWALIAPRLNMQVAARVKLELARTHGTAVELNGRVHHVFPGPEVLLELDQVAGLSDEKVARLRGLARAALDGLLDADRLRALGDTEALAQLQAIRGIGPWSASHIYYRGAAPIDGLPTAEPRVLHGFAHASGSELPSVAAFARAAESFRPFRMWVTVLLSRHLARTDRWRAPELVQQRERAGRALAKQTRGRTRTLPL